MKKTKVTRNKSSMVKMWWTLQNDIRNATEVSYNSDSLHLMMGFSRVEWRLEGKKWYRWDGDTLTYIISDPVVKSFQFQSVFGEYLAVRVEDKYGRAVAEMFKVW